MPTLSERIRDVIEDTLVERPLLAKVRVILRAIASELEGKVAVTPVTVELDPGVWVTKFPRVEVHGASPEESLTSFVERVEEVERDSHR